MRIWVSLDDKTIRQHPKFKSPREKLYTLFMQFGVSFETSFIRRGVRRQVRPEGLPSEGLVNFLADAVDTPKELYDVRSCLVQTFKYLVVICVGMVYCGVMALGVAG